VSFARNNFRIFCAQKGAEPSLRLPETGSGGYRSFDTQPLRRSLRFREGQPPRSSAVGRNLWGWLCDHVRREARDRPRRRAAPAVRRPHTPGHGRLKRAAVEALVSNGRKRIFRSAASWPYTFKFVSPVAATAAGIFLSVTLFSCHSLLACYLLDPVSVYRLRYSTALSTAQRSASTCAEHFTLILMHRRP